MRCQTKSVVSRLKTDPLLGSRGEKEDSSAVFVTQVSDTIVFIEIFQRMDVINAVFVTQIECG